MALKDVRILHVQRLEVPDALASAKRLDNNFHKINPLFAPGKKKKERTSWIWNEIKQPVSVSSGALRCAHAFARLFFHIHATSLCHHWGHPVISSHPVLINVCSPAWPFSVGAFDSSSFAQGGVLARSTMIQICALYNLSLSPVSPLSTEVISLLPSLTVHHPPSLI